MKALFAWLFIFGIWFTTCLFFSKGEIFWGCFESMIILLLLFEKGGVGIRNWWKKDMQEEIDDIRETLLWMAQDKIDPYYRKMHKREREHYDFLINTTHDGRIKKQMSVEELLDVVNKFGPKDDEDDVSGCAYNYKHALENKKDSVIVFSGYGRGVPTPKVYVWIKDGKISSIKQDYHGLTNGEKQIEVGEVPMMRENREKMEALQQKTDSILRDGQQMMDSNKGK